jgi:hypothetical protein
LYRSPDARGGIGFQAAGQQAASNLKVRKEMKEYKREKVLVRG